MLLQVQSIIHIPLIYVHTNDIGEGGREDGRQGERERERCNDPSLVRLSGRDRTTKLSQNLYVNFLVLHSTLIYQTLNYKHQEQGTGNKTWNSNDLLMNKRTTNIFTVLGYLGGRGKDWDEVMPLKSLSSICINIMEITRKSTWWIVTSIMGNA